MNFYERADYLECAHIIVDSGDTDVTHEQVDAWNDGDLQDWVDNWAEDDGAIEDIDHPGFDVDFLW